MELREFQQLQERIEDLLQSNDAIRRERKLMVEKLSLRERQIEELKEKCKRYELSRKEAYKKINAILNKLNDLIE